MTDPTTLTILGSINHDITLRTAALPMPGETREITGRSSGLGGKGANQAIAAARLAGNSTLIGSVGTDQIGGALLTQLTREGVDVSLVTRTSSPTGTAYVVVDDDGENEILIEPGANQHVTLPNELHGPVLCQFEVPPATVAAAAELATGYLAINAAPARTIAPALLDRADVIIANESEDAALPELRAARLAIVTLGARGAVAYSRGRELARAPGTPTVVSSTVGAGDAFCAALVLALIRGVDLDVALAAACAVGAEAVASASTHPRFALLETYLP